MSNATVSLAAVAAVAAGLAGSSAHAAPTIYHLGALGGITSWGFAISPSGKVAGCAANQGYATHATVYVGTPGTRSATPEPLAVAAT